MNEAVIIREAKVVGVNGNLVMGATDHPIAMNEVVYVVLEGPKKQLTRLKAEVIRIRGREFDMQVFEDTTDIKMGQSILLSGDLLTIELGPGLLGQVFDGLGNPLNALAKTDGYFLKRGSMQETIDKQREFFFQKLVEVGDVVQPSQALGLVKEGPVDHRIMVPFSLSGSFRVLSLSDKKLVTANDTIATIEHVKTGVRQDVSLCQKWPVKIPLDKYEERLLPTMPLMTKVRIVDAVFPIAEGGTAAVPGPFGSGKTVFLQSIARFSDADVVIVAACGERAGEVVELLHEFLYLKDAKSGRSLMERTIIICNTSSMPVSARETSIYTAVTMGEYYRQMGLRVLLLADSTSRWAQAAREISGRLEEIPGVEAYPAYLGSMIAALYERSGKVKLRDQRLGESTGSLTIIGTVSPAGGNFLEPVTQATLSVVGCFLGLTYARSYAKRFPAVAPLDSWSNYFDGLSVELDRRYYEGFASTIKRLKSFYEKGQAIADQMKVIGEEDMSLADFVHYLKAEFFDAVFLQQNAFHDVDASPSEDRIACQLKHVASVIDHEFACEKKDDARRIFLRLSVLFRNLNLTCLGSDDYVALIKELNTFGLSLGYST